jgi:hypothetical protein
MNKTKSDSENDNCYQSIVLELCPFQMVYVAYKSIWSIVMKNEIYCNLPVGHLYISLYIVYLYIS